MKLDLLAFGAHPDDVELGCGGTLIKMASKGYLTGIVDLTAGELGTRGDSKIRQQEAESASKVLQLSVRENLGMKDGFFDLSDENRLAVVRMIRKYRPEIVICNAVTDRHPDHGRASVLVSESCFLSGLRKITLEHNGEVLEPWRPYAVYHYIQDRYLKPDIIVDISAFMDKKMEAILTFSSQFYKAGSNEPETPLSSPHFLEFLKARSIEYGRLIGSEFGEGFLTERPAGIDDLMLLK
jgi:bacillithiol biosynthesis deacetylase BshB1